MSQMKDLYTVLGLVREVPPSLTNVLTLNEAAQLLDVQAKTVKMWCWRGYVEYRETVGNHYLIDLDSLLAHYNGRNKNGKGGIRGR